MKKLALAVAATGLLVCALVTPARAANSSAPVPVMTTICTDGYLNAGQVGAAKGGDRKVHGFANFEFSTSCGDKIFYFEGSGGSWKVTATPFTGSVVDVAADGNGTSYLMYISRKNGSSQLAVARRSTAGKFGTDAVIATVSEQAGQDGRGSLVAKNGLWYAIWPEYSAATGTYTLVQAETMFGGGADPGAPYLPTPTTPKTSDTHPVLALAPDGQPRLFWQRAASGGKQDLLLAAGVYGAWGDAVPVATGVTISAAHPGLDLAVTDRRTFTSWTTKIDNWDAVVVGSNSGDSRWSTSTPPANPNPASWDAHLQASSSTVFAAFGAGDDQPGGALLSVKNGSAAWSVGAQDDVPASIDTFGVGALIYNGSGRTSTLIYSGHSLYAVNR